MSRIHHTTRSHVQVGGIILRDLMISTLVLASRPDVLISTVLRDLDEGTSHACIRRGWRGYTGNRCNSGSRFPIMTRDPLQFSPSINKSPSSLTIVFGPIRHRRGLQDQKFGLQEFPIPRVNRGKGPLSSSREGRADQVDQTICQMAAWGRLRVR